jgi:small subunit ribosomal protein S18
MADTNVQDHIGRGPATPPLADMAEEPVPVTAQTPVSAGAAAQTTAPGGTPPSRTTADGASPAPAPGYATHRPAGRARREGGRERGTYGGRRRVCGFCVDNVQRIDYKDTVRLRRFLSERGKIEPRRKTGTCAKHQRWLTTALKRARELALLPYTAEHVRFMGR